MMSDRPTKQTDDAGKQRVYRFHRLFPWIGAFVSVSAALLIVAHIKWPEKAIDTTTVALLVVVILPWILPFIRSIELPGGTKIELSDLQFAGSVFLHPEDGKSATTADAAQEAQSVIAEGMTDPSIALVRLRIDLERMLRDAFGTTSPRRHNISLALERLRRRGILSELEASALQRILLVLNQAAHGVEVEPEAAAWALTDGQRIVGELDSRLHAIETERRIEEEARQLFKNAGAGIHMTELANDFVPMVAELREHRIAFEAVALAEDFRLRQAVVHINKLIDSASATEGLIVSSKGLALPAQYEGVRVISIDDLADYVSELATSSD